MVNLFCELDENGLVIRSIVAGHVDGEEGEQWCQSIYGGNWKQANTPQRRYAEPGFKYLAEHDLFIGIKPFESWILDENFMWSAPIPYPNDGKVWGWKEETLSWEFVRDE
jgi:hypothetical protein